VRSPGAGSLTCLRRSCSPGTPICAVSRRMPTSAELGLLADGVRRVRIVRLARADPRRTRPAVRLVDYSAAPGAPPGHGPCTDAVDHVSAPCHNRGHQSGAKWPGTAPMCSTRWSQVVYAERAATPPLWRRGLSTSAQEAPRTGFRWHRFPALDQGAVERCAISDTDTARDRRIRVRPGPTERPRLPGGRHGVTQPAFEVRVGACSPRCPDGAPLVAGSSRGQLWRRAHRARSGSRPIWRASGSALPSRWRQRWLSSRSAASSASSTSAAAR
jgi:hypothetical protein